MKFLIEEEVQDIDNKISTSYYVWVRHSENELGTCFSLHKSLEEAKKEIEIIKDIYPEKNTHYINLPNEYPKEIKIQKETILDRHDNYTIKDIFYLFVDNKVIARKYTLEDIFQEADKIVKNNQIVKKSKIVFETNK
jgi:hypothetical protein